MDLDQVLNLFDLFWFEHKIFYKRSSTSKEIDGVESRRRLRGRRMRGSENRSHLELEFEELKGFMDLGFVFSEEDKGSSLASIVPGLNRLAGKREEEEEEEEERKLCGEISRPYLSEAWEEEQEEEGEEEELRKPLKMKWKFPHNQIHMKVHLKWWAHVVASTIR